MRDFAASFYKSTAWKDCRAAYIKSVGGLCERCLARGLYVPGVIVHHRTHLTPENIGNAEIALGFDNLILVCRDCHALEHRKNDRRYKVDEFGHVECI